LSGRANVNIWVTY